MFPDNDPGDLGYGNSSASGTAEARPVDQHSTAFMLDGYCNDPAEIEVKLPDPMEIKVKLPRSGKGKGSSTEWFEDGCHCSGCRMKLESEKGTDCFKCGKCFHDACFKFHIDSCQGQLKPPPPIRISDDETPFRVDETSSSSNTWKRESGRGNILDPWLKP